MRCSELEPLVVPFVDGEAPEASRADVDAHLDACPPCRARVDAERAARDLLRAGRERLHTDAPPELRSRCAAICGRPRRAAVRRMRFAIGLVAAASVLVGFVWFGRTDAGTPVLAAQLTLDHIKCSKFNSRRVSGSPAELSAYWRERYGWPILIPAGLAPGMRLSGVRRCGSSDGETAHIMYTHDGRPVSLFVARDRGRTPRVLATFGHEAVVWSAAGRTYVLVGDEPRAEMESIAAAIRKELPPQ